MVNDNIEYATIDEQIEKLKSQHLIIKNENFAAESLSCFGYSNLIKSYREPYIITSGTSKIYRSGVTFDQICSLFILDKNLRNAVMAAMLDLEEHIKEAAADVVASSFGSHQDNYLQYRNYRNISKPQRRFTLPGILDSLRRTLDTDKDPICHYRTEHGIVPPWILFKSVYFSTIVNFIDLFKIEQQEQLVHHLYNVEDSGLDVTSLRKLMMDTLFICNEYRNLAAHGGRTYNHICKATVRYEEIFGTDVTSGGFSQLLLLLSLLKYHAPFERLDSVLRDEVNRHCSAFSQDVTYLGQILNINIIPRTTVHISSKSNKFHFNPYCSGINPIEELALEEALEKGYVPCKRCAKDL